MKKILLLSVFILSITQIFAQSEQDTKQVIQFSGIVVTQDSIGDVMPLPYTTVGIKGSSRGTYSEIDGFFSIAAERGDTLIFSRIGFQTTEHTVPDSLESNFYSWYQVMSEDEILLPEAVIYPWPSREHYKLEFLALDVSNELRQRAEENLAAEILNKMQTLVSVDGQNAYEVEKAQAQAELYYNGQLKPQKIFDVVAWSQFIKAWKNGDFKRKRKEDGK